MTTRARAEPPEEIFQCSCNDMNDVTFKGDTLDARAGQTVSRAGLHHNLQKQTGALECAG
jgi:hypothetical protein